MAEELKNTELTNTTSGVTSQGLVGNVSNTLEKIRKFSNEPAVQRSIPVMITLFVIFLGLVFFISFREPSRTALFSALPEHEKSRVVDVLRNNGINVSIDQTTGEIQHQFMTYDKIKKYFNWKPEFDLEEGLSITIDWYLENKNWLENIKSGQYLKYYKKQFN